MKNVLQFLLLIILKANPIFAQPGSIDKSFGEPGKQYYSSLHIESDVVIVQQDGKILIGGSQQALEIQDIGIVIARFKSDGTVDESFGDQGSVVIKTFEGSKAVNVTTLIQQPDGKILAGGRFITSYGDIGIIRLNIDGSLDESFGTNGIVITSIGTEDLFGDMALQPDGKIVVGGKKGLYEGQGDDFLIRYLPNGKADKSFGDNGIVFTHYISSSTLGAVALQRDGKILTSGIYGITTRQYQVARYNNNGSIDSSFGVNGFGRLIPEQPDRYALHVYDMCLQPNGKILVTGQAANYQMGLARFDSSGLPDLDFGDKHGYTVLPMENGSAEARNVFITPELKIILTGRYSVKAGVSIATVAYSESGMLDSSFGENGIAASGFDSLANGTTFESGEGALQADGNIVVSGSFLENADTYYNLAIFRFNGYSDKRAKYVKIKRWLHHHGFTWEDKPGNDISYYSIQRSSSNGFADIARVFRNSNKQQSFEDAGTATGSYSYRVAAVTESGNITYSNTITIESNTASIKVYPNPVKNSLQIEGLPANSKTKLTVTDLTSTARIVTTVNSSTYTLNVAQLTKGNYMIKIESGSVVVTKQFLKE